MQRPYLSGVLALLLTLMLTGFAEQCGGSGEPPPGTLYGQVVDVAGRPIADAAVDLEGAYSLTTDAGMFEFHSIPAGRYRINVSAEGYVPASGFATVIGDSADPEHPRNSTSVITMMRQGERQVFLAGREAVLYQDRARLRLPARSLVYSSGPQRDKLVGDDTQVSAILKMIDVATEERWAAPGDLVGIPAETEVPGSRERLWSLGMFYAELFVETADGPLPVNLAEGQFARLEIDLAGRSQVWDTLVAGSIPVPMWVYDEYQGAWVEVPEATGRIEPPATPGGPYTATAELPHFSYWNFDYAASVDPTYSWTTCGTAQVFDASLKGVVGASIRVDSYKQTSSGLSCGGGLWAEAQSIDPDPSKSSDDGQFCIQVVNANLFTVFKLDQNTYAECARNSIYAYQTLKTDDGRQLTLRSNTVTYDALDQNGDGTKNDPLTQASTCNARWDDTTASMQNCTTTTSGSIQPLKSVGQKLKISSNACVEGTLNLTAGGQVKVCSPGEECTTATLQPDGSYRYNIGISMYSSSFDLKVIEYNDNTKKPIQTIHLADDDDALIDWVLDHCQGDPAKCKPSDPATGQGGSCFPAPEIDVCVPDAGDQRQDGTGKVIGDNTILSPPLVGLKQSFSGSMCSAAGDPGDASDTPGYVNDYRISDTSFSAVSGDRIFFTASIPKSGSKPSVKGMVALGLSNANKNRIVNDRCIHASNSACDPEKADVAYHVPPLDAPGYLQTQTYYARLYSELQNPDNTYTLSTNKLIGWDDFESSSPANPNGNNNTPSLAFNVAATGYVKGTSSYLNFDTIRDGATNPIYQWLSTDAPTSSAPDTVDWYRIPAQSICPSDAPTDFRQTRLNAKVYRFNKPASGSALLRFEVYEETDAGSGQPAAAPKFSVISTSDGSSVVTRDASGSVDFCKAVLIKVSLQGTQGTPAMRVPYQLQLQASQKLNYPCQYSTSDDVHEDEAEDGDVHHDVKSTCAKPILPQTGKYIWDSNQEVNPGGAVNADRPLGLKACPANDNANTPGYWSDGEDWFKLPDLRQGDLLEAVVTLPTDDTEIMLSLVRWSVVEDATDCKKTVFKSESRLWTSDFTQFDPATNLYRTELYYNEASNLQGTTVQYFLGVSVNGYENSYRLVVSRCSPIDGGCEEEFWEPLEE